MKIIHLLAENYKRLVAVEVTPDGHLIDVAGRNAQGKSSLLDSIFAALAGKDAIPSKPIRKGADSARIELKLGDGTTVNLVVRRTFKRAEDGAFTTSVVVENADGARYGSPQKVLDGLLGALSFDPLAFARMAAKDQLGELRKLVPGFDFEAADEANADDFTRRTELNRRARQHRARLDGLTVPGDPRQVHVDESALFSELEAAGEKHAEIERTKSRRALILQSANDCRASVARWDKTIAEGREKLRSLAAAIEDAEKARVTDIARADEIETKLEQLPQIEIAPDTHEIRARIDAARKTNAEIAARERVLAERAELEDAITIEETEAKKLTAAIDKRNEQKAAAIAAAQLPVEGLGLGDDGVLFDGLPFDQASDAERLRVSVAIAAAMNPKLRVVRIRDGSLLDAAGVLAIAEFAQKNDLQIWREVVADDAKTGIVIEDGRIAAKEVAA